VTASGNDIQVKIGRASGIDLDRHVLLLRQSFGQSAWASQIGATLTREFYRWKYFSPAGEAMTASVLLDGELASSVAALPTLFRTPDGVKKGWQIADIATLPWARRKGLYRRCLQTLVDRLGEDILVCFPNDNSKKAIAGQGFGLAAEVRTFLRPLNPFATAPRLIADGVVSFREPDLAAPEAGFSFFRQPDQLEWRYRKSPACRYAVVATDTGHCVSRSFSLFGSTVSIVMEVAADGEGAFCDLVRQSEHVAAGSGMRASFIMTSSPLPQGLRKRYLPLPHMLLPKRQTLFVRMPGAKVPSATWNVQIGDWDGL
jgi:hypothetical protein